MFLCSLASAAGTGGGAGLPPDCLTTEESAKVRVATLRRRWPQDSDTLYVSLVSMATVSS